MLHATSSERVKHIWYSDEIRRNIVEESIWINEGDTVSKFTGSNHTLGTMILRFDSNEEMLYKMDNMEEFLQVIVE